MLSEKNLTKTIKDFYPDYPDQVINDFAHLLNGNAVHVRERLDSIKEKDVVRVNHQEQVVCLGTGFDWLHLPNFALIVNPVAIDPVMPFTTQLKVLKDNWDKNRIPHDQGMLVMVSTSYRELVDKKAAQLKAIAWLDFAQEIIKKDYPELVAAGLQVIAGTMDTNTRLFEMLHEDILVEFSKSGYVAPTELNGVATFVVKHNKSQHEEFITHYNIRQRTLYREEYPTEIMALKCMDGRIHLPIATGTPMGIIQPMRNVGSKFHFGWEAFKDKVTAWVRYSIARKRNCLILVTYHFSKIDSHLGCAGHGYDTEAAKRNAYELAKQARFIFGVGKNSEVNVAVIGFNTDVNAIVVHGMQEGQILDIEKEVSQGERPVSSEKTSATATA